MPFLARLALANSLFIFLVACGSDNGDSGTPPILEPEPVFSIGSGSGADFSAGTLSISATELAGGDSVTVTASVANESGGLLTEDASVTFRSDCTATDKATIDSPVSVIDGFATTTYQPQGCVGTDNITASVTVNGETSTASGSVTVRQRALLGTDPGTGFVPGAIAIGMDSISAGGNTTVGVSIADSDGNAVTATAASVTFTSTCVMNGLASIDSPVAVEGSLATTTYSARGCSGDDTITASVTIDGARTTATGTLTVLPAVIGSLRFVSAVPEAIGIRGFGLNEVSKVTFSVLDINGNPVRNELVNFSLNTSVGGISISSSSASSDAAGQVSVDVRSGFVHTSVAVSAELASNPALGTQSDKLVVSTGIADQNSMSIGASKLNPEGLNIDGTTSELSVHAADHFNNPVPDGTAIAFTTEGGLIQAQCLTVEGSCSATWTSSNPRPVDGRATVLATLIGEEGFTDTNGNGVLDADDTFLDTSEEAYRDDTENGEFDQGIEEFLDFNNNGVFDGADEAYNGVLCCDAAAVGDAVGGDACFGLTPTGAMCSANRNVHVRASIVLVMTSSVLSIEADRTELNGAGENSDGTLVSIFGVMEDGSHQFPPFGTAIEVIATNGELESAGSYEIRSSNINGPYQFFLAWKGDDESSFGKISITATTESGSVSGPLILGATD